MDLKGALTKVLSGNLVAQFMTGILGLYLINKMPIDVYADFTLYQTLVFLVIGLVVGPFNRILLVTGRQDVTEWILPLQFVLMLPIAVYAYFYLAGDVLVWALFCLVSLFLLVFEFYKGLSQKSLDFSLYRQLVGFRAFVYVLVSFSLLIFLHEKVSSFVCYLAFSALVAYLCSIILLFSYQSVVPLSSLFKCFPSVGDLRYVLGGYGYLFLYFMLSAIFSQFDFMFLRFFSDESELATYGASFQYYLFLMMVMSSLKQVLLPLLIKNKSMTFIGMTKMLTPIYAAFAVLVVFLVIYFEVWAGLVEGGRYESTDVVFSVLAISLLFSMICSPASEFLQVEKMYKGMLLVLLLASLCNVFLNYHLVGAYGAVGVSIATLISFVFLNFSFVVMSCKCDVVKASC